ncbi:MAG TPA: hypothetical protein VNU71_10870 [Burkholderiaceae bacterium]|nr:hypothetical protein [Burkholderiaceae bacterium]
MNRQQQIDQFLLAAHRLALARLRADPARIEPVRAQLMRWRQQSGPTRSDPYWEEWKSLLLGDVADLERVVCADDDRGALLRSVSPMSTLVTQAERMALLRAARSA